MSTSPDPHTLQNVLFWLWFTLNLPLHIVVCLNSARLQAVSPYGKKIAFLLLFCVYYITGKTLFRDIHTGIATALPTASLYLINAALGRVKIVGITGGIACGKSTLVNHLR